MFDGRYIGFFEKPPKNRKYPKNRVFGLEIFFSRFFRFFEFLTTKSIYPPPLGVIVLLAITAFHQKHEKSVIMDNIPIPPPSISLKIISQKPPIHNILEPFCVCVCVCVCVSVYQGPVFDCACLMSSGRRRTSFSMDRLYTYHIKRGCPKRYLPK